MCIGINLMICKTFMEKMIITEGHKEITLIHDIQGWEHPGL